MITPLTGPAAAIGKPLTAGDEVWFKYLNQEKGGIAGEYQVILDEEDSQYVPRPGSRTTRRSRTALSPRQRRSTPTGCPSRT